MTTTKQRILFLIVLTSFFGAVSSYAYPIYVKIENPRVHSLFIGSDTEKIEIEIPSGSSREFKIASENDWRVRYSTGILGAAGRYQMDRELNFFIETSCRNCMADNWLKKTVKYCALRLDQLDVAQGPQSYTLTVTEIRDLDIAFDSDICRLNANEQSLKVIPIGKTATLVAADVIAKAVCLYRNIK